MITLDSEKRLFWAKVFTGIVFVGLGAYIAFCLNRAIIATALILVWVWILIKLDKKCYDLKEKNRNSSNGIGGHIHSVGSSILQKRAEKGGRKNEDNR